MQRVLSKKQAGSNQDENSGQSAEVGEQSSIQKTTLNGYGFIVTGKPSEQALTKLIDSLLKHVIEHNLYDVKEGAPKEPSEQ